MFENSASNSSVYCAVYRNYILHSDPQRIEETFPMAMTYMVEPKEASVSRIKKYILDYYKDDISMDRWLVLIEQGKASALKVLCVYVGGQGSGVKSALMLEMLGCSVAENVNE